KLDSSEYSPLNESLRDSSVLETITPSSSISIESLENLFDITNTLQPTNDRNELYKMYLLEPKHSLEDLKNSSLQDLQITVPLPSKSDNGSPLNENETFSVIDSPPLSLNEILHTTRKKKKKEKKILSEPTQCIDDETHRKKILKI